jgi:hypothetical protein
MTGWKSIEVDIDSLQGVDVLEDTGHALVALATNAAFGGAAVPPPDGRARWTVPYCPVYLGYWICAVCCRAGVDERKGFCPFGMAGVL